MNPKNVMLMISHGSFEIYTADSGSNDYRLTHSMDGEPTREAVAGALVASGYRLTDAGWTASYYGGEDVAIGVVYPLDGSPITLHPIPHLAS